MHNEISPQVKLKKKEKKGLTVVSSTFAFGIFPNNKYVLSSFT